MERNKVISSPDGLLEMPIRPKWVFKTFQFLLRAIKEFIVNIFLHDKKNFPTEASTTIILFSIISFSFTVPSSASQLQSEEI